MPFYYGLKNLPKEERKRAASKLLILRKEIDKQIKTTRTLNDTLLLATWNIRNFDSNHFKHGHRLSESLYYIAEIISTFDVIALQEIDKNLSALNRVKDILGWNWNYIATDVTEGVGGNRERIAFMYDRRKVRFRNISGEIVLPDSQLVSDHRQFARTPFIVAFQSGWFKFMLCTVHIYYGKDSGPKLQRRIDEIKSIAKFLTKRAKDSPNNYILIGDFNIKSPQHETMKALTDNGFFIPQELDNVPPEARGNDYYDQIAFSKDGCKGEFRFTEKAGVFDYYTILFTDQDFDEYLKHMPKDKLPSDQAGKKKYYKKWRTFQMSDHLPMWVELQIDFSGDYLEKLKTG